jgi:hypothetical protein
VQVEPPKRCVFIQLTIGEVAKKNKEFSMRQYALTALVVILALSAATAYAWPTVSAVLEGFQIIGAALAGSK